MALSTRRGGNRSRTRFTLILLILTSITLLTLDFRGFSPLDSARSAVLDAFEPVGDFASDTFEPVSDAWNGAFDYDRVEQENEQLRQQVDDLEGQITSGDVAKQSLQQLLEQVDIPFVGDLPTVGARVVSGAVANFDTTIEIDKGESDGVRRGMAVVTGRGLVGRVVNTSGDRAVVELLSGGNISVAFSLVGTNVLGVARGTADGTRLSATVDVDRLVFPGQILVTSGTEGSTFPQGLPIGTVTEVRSDQSALEQALTVQMLADLSDLTFVSIVQWEPAAR
jgi:rod shape-determining protein MreC